MDEEQNPFFYLYINPPPRVKGRKDNYGKKGNEVESWWDLESKI